MSFTQLLVASKQPGKLGQPRPAGEPDPDIYAVHETLDFDDGLLSPLHLRTPAECGP
jgi:hypothetical protein